MDWEGGPYMYDGVNLPRHAKSKREVSKEGMCQRDAEYGRNKAFCDLGNSKKRTSK